MSGRLTGRKVPQAVAGGAAATVEVRSSPGYETRVAEPARRVEPVAAPPAARPGLFIHAGPDWDVQTQSPDADLGQLLEYEQLWLTLDAGWSSLAVLGTASQASEQEVGLNLARVGCEAGHPITLFDATGVRLSQTDHLIEQIRLQRATGARVIVVLESLADNPAGFALAQAVDEIALVVRPGLSKLASIDRTIELIGAERIRGIVSRPAKRKRARAADAR